MQVVLPDIQMLTAARIETERPMTDDEFWEFCAGLPKHLRVEREPNGDIVITPPAGFETSYRNVDICYQLSNWARADGRGLRPRWWSGSKTAHSLAG